MRKLFYVAIALACIVCFAVFNSEQTAQSLRRVSRHQVWSPPCRNKCSDAQGVICGYFLQGCCTRGFCKSSWGSEECQEGKKLQIEGCTTN